MASASDADVPLKRCDDDAIVDLAWPRDAESSHLSHLFEMIARQGARENYAVRSDFALDGDQRWVTERRQRLDDPAPQFVEATVQRRRLLIDSSTTCLEVLRRLRSFETGGRI